jgi:predicted nucleic acid-binding protein
MRYRLDTNVWIHYLKHLASPVEARLRRTPAHEVAVYSVVWAELLHGARKYENREQRVARIERTLSPYCSLPFDGAAILVHGDVAKEV